MAKDVKCKYCKKLKNHWCKAVLDSPDEDLTRECRHFIHKTNADRIRAMSDEEFAEFICGVYDDGVYQDECGKFINGTIILDYDENKILEWLKQPVEVDNG